MTTQRMLTGDRPTGKLHLGHYVGSIRNRVRLQREHDGFFLLADVHMLTTKNAKQDIASVAQNARHVVLDALTAGIEPERATFYLQSGIPEIGDLNALLQNLVTVPRLERIPSLKDVLRDAGLAEMPYGLLGYPVLLAADVLGMKAQVVPVGKDIAPHVEVAREIARRFNSQYGETFPVPELISSDAPTLPGTTGQSKMSKSLDNAIYLSDDAQAVQEKVMRMDLDPGRTDAARPGAVEDHPIFVYHRLFNADVAEVEDLKTRYRAGRVGDAEVKEKLAAAINRLLEPMLERRARFEHDDGLIDRLIFEGTQRARRQIQQTVSEARTAMGFTAVFNRIRGRAEQSRPATPSAAVMGATDA